MTTFALYTLGCKVNQEEGAAISSAMKNSGYTEVPFSDQADFYIINTCTVTHTADSKSRQMISRAKKKNPTALIVVTGCYAQTDTDAVLRLNYADLICGNNEKAQIVPLIEKALSEKRTNSADSALICVEDIMQAHTFKPLPLYGDGGQKRARAYLKIEDGCEQFCNYCIIPYARGPIRSMPIEQAVKEAEILCSAGHKELVLTGIHIGAYGYRKGYSLSDLLRALLKIEGLLRIRLGSIEVKQIDDELIALMRQEKRICRHLHIPLQSGCSKTLAAMGRNYDAEYFAKMCAKLRNNLDGLAITTDIMTGFPGEDEQDFNECAVFVESMQFASAHIFPYSQRKGTKAAQMSEQVNEYDKARRAKILSEITTKSKIAFMQQFIGKKVDILPEKEMIFNKKTYIFGHTDNFLPVLCQDADKEQDILLSCLVTGMEKDRLLAVPY